MSSLLSCPVVELQYAGALLHMILVHKLCGLECMTSSSVRRPDQQAPMMHLVHAMKVTAQRLLCTGALHQ